MYNGATYTPSTLNFEVGTETSDPLSPLGTTVVLEFEPFMTPDLGGSVLQRR
jgi:hypothetical protein